MIPITVLGKQYVSNISHDGCVGCAGLGEHGAPNTTLCTALPFCSGLIFKEYTDLRVPLAEPATIVDNGAAYENGFAAGLAAKQAEWDKWQAGRAVQFNGTVHAFTRSTDPATSVKAAQGMTSKAGRIIDLILVELTNSPMTGKQLAANTGVALNSITPRFAQLSRKGLIHAAGGSGRETIWALGNGVQA